MFCKHCGKVIKPDDNFCPYCGKPAVAEEKIIQKPKIKTYSSTFWKYFGMLILTNVLIGIFEFLEMPIFWIIILGVYTYFFCQMVNEAMLSIGKKGWWPLGLLVLIPFGFWITFFIVRAQLKLYGKWSIKGEGMSPIVIVGIIIGFIAVIGILAGIVLVSMSSARARARDARRIADIREVVSAVEMFYGDNGFYPITSNWSELEWMLSDYLFPLPIDPLNEYPCVYSYNSHGGIHYKITYCSESEGKIIKKITSY